MSAAKEIESSHIRARNFKQRHAFLKLLTSASIEDETNAAPGVNSLGVASPSTDFMMSMINQSNNNNND